MKNWYKPLDSDIKVSVLTKILPSKGNLVYEYNPFRNYRLSKNMYEYDGQLYTETDLNKTYGIYWDKSYESQESEVLGGWYIQRQGENDRTYLSENTPIPKLTGELVDFVTDELQFDLAHPVTMIPQYSYDGSVNLILTDGKNQPRIINSRFSATGKDTYEIIDRKGSNDTNIYDQGDQFEIDTSLYKRVKQIPKLILKDISSGGNLKCGNYHFYFKFADADGNETDFVAESGLVSIFVGENYPQAVYTGNRDENAVKQVTFIMKNIDPAYSYVHVYYSRATAEDGNNRVMFYAKIDKKYVVNNFQECQILVTGFEPVDDISKQDINLHFNIADAAKTAETAKSMLFLGNVHKPNIPFETLNDLSLRFLPYLKDRKYDIDIDEEYSINSTSRGYYDPIYIYNNVGYWNKELYRLGIVYILSTGELTPVFNIRGRTGLTNFKEAVRDSDTKNYCDDQYNYYRPGVPIKYNDSNNLIIPPETEEGIQGINITNENIKGVISLDSPDDTSIIHSIEVHVDNDTIEKLRKLGIKGYFFVRQTRIPLTLAQGITIGIDTVGRIPTIPTTGGVLEELAEDISDNTYVETKDIYQHNYISEGFLSRYNFDLKRKSSGIWGLIGKIAIAVAVGAAATAGTITVAGTAVATDLAATIGTAITTVGSALGVIGVSAALTIPLGAAVVGAAVGAAAGAIAGAAVGGVDELVKLSSRLYHSKELKGRHTEIPNGYKRAENDKSRLLGQSFKDRIIIKDYTHNEVGGIICPDYDVCPQYYNQLFTGGEFVIKTAASQATINQFKDIYSNDSENKQIDVIKVGYAFTNSGRHFYMPWKAYTSSESIRTYTARLQAVPDNITCATIGRTKFRSRAGDAAEAWRYECVGEDFKNIPSFYSISKEAEEKKESDSDVQVGALDSLSSEELKVETAEKESNSDIVRGAFGPYIGMVDYPGNPGETVQIMIPGYSDTLMPEYIKIRMDDMDPYYAITDRIDINDLENFYASNSRLRNDASLDETCIFEINRGDCYICQFTHRLNRNFNDNSAPYNSEIVDSNSWRDHYKINKSEEFSKINVGDVNAVNLGMWVTFMVRSNRNLNIRSVDGSVIAETAMMGHPKGFFPHDGMIAEGSHKSAEALVYNDGFCKNLSERLNTIEADVPYDDRERNWYGTRIMYSDIHINNGYKNGFRVFQGTNFRDYTRQYGSITKLVNFNDNLLVVFEHGLAVLSVNERVIAGQGTSGTVYINAEKVLPETLSVISESYGSLWPDSILITPHSGDEAISVFGVDTCAKKIWKFDGSGLKIISDFKVQEFLNQNLTLTEREKEPILGIRNVKTTYNAYKHDVMFTFYDDLSGVEEKVWNLCYNTLLGKFITFYSWVPSFMENINNIPFSFNRNVSKWIAKLGQSHAENSFAEGIVLSNNIYDNTGNPVGGSYIQYKKKDAKGVEHDIFAKCYAKKGAPGTLLGVFNLLEHVLPEGEDVEYFIKFEKLRDIYGYYNNFEVDEVIAEIDTVDGEGATPADKNNYKLNKVYGLYLKHSTDSSNPLYFSELYYRNKAGHTYNDYDNYKITISEYDPEHCYLNDGTKLTKDNYFSVIQELNLPVFHSRDGAKPSLPNPISKETLVQLLNIKATIYAKYNKPNEDGRYTQSLSDFLKQIKAEAAGNEGDKVLFEEGWYNAGSYESSVAITSEWNLQYLSADFWKHGQAGVIDKTEDITPTKWYGEQHPFEFEVIVGAQDAIETHKIFQNIELIANKAKPESFHFEVIGEAYDFAKDKPNMYFRQEARKALFQYNGCSISYDKNFRKINPKQQAKSAELIYNYFERQDTLEDIYDKYNLKDSEKQLYFPQYEAWANLSPNKDYRHLSGAEIVYYPNRQEYRVWQHQPAIDINDLPQDNASSVIRGNCQYLEDRWKISINPLLICYKNEYTRKVSGALCQPENSTWFSAATSNLGESQAKLPPITIRNTCLPKAIVKKGELEFPGIPKDETQPQTIGKDNGLYGLYYTGTDSNRIWPIDNTNWLSDLSVYKMSFGEAQNRRETDIRDKFVKVRIRYSGEELAIIDFLNTIYTISHA